MLRSRSISAAALFTFALFQPLSLAAQEASVLSPNEDSPSHPWFLRLEGGSTQIHDWGETGPRFAFRGGRDLTRSGIARVGLGLTYSGVDGGFGTIELDLEVIPLQDFVVSPIVAGGIGVLAETDWGGFTPDVSVGLVVWPAGRFSLVGLYQWASHGGISGPNGWYIGVEASL